MLQATHKRSPWRLNCAPQNKLQATYCVLPDKPNMLSGNLKRAPGRPEMCSQATEYVLDNLNMLTQLYR